MENRGNRVTGRREIPGGLTVHMGKPAKPLAHDLVDKIAGLVAGMPGVLQAWLPQCYIKGVIDPPAQVVILVVGERSLDPAIDAELGRRIRPSNFQRDSLTSWSSRRPTTS
jgi:hypothetical protein